MIRRIKHIAVAVNDVDAALGTYQRRLGITDVRRVDWPQGRSREAHFSLGEVEIQLCQSMDPDGRFAQHIARSGRIPLYSFLRFTKSCGSVSIPESVW